MVYRVYVEKRPELAQEAQSLLADLRGSLQIDALTGLRLFNRYDVEHIDEALFERCVQNVFSEPQVDRTYAHLEHDGATLLAVEYLPGQFDQRADSAAQCIQILAQCERPTVRTAKIYALYGALSEQELAAIRRHLINPVESREATLDRFETLDMAYAAPAPVPVLPRTVVAYDSRFLVFPGMPTQSNVMPSLSATLALRVLMALIILSSLCSASKSVNGASFQ